MLLDWAFYHHRFDLASVRVGRIPAPFGFLSETREVGNLLPFYRAPTSYYLESLRSIDGAMATNEHAFAGGHSRRASPAAARAHGDHLPAPGLSRPYVAHESPLRAAGRCADGLQHAHRRCPASRRPGVAAFARYRESADSGPCMRLDLLNAGIDARFDRAFARGETRRIKNGPAPRRTATISRLACARSASSGSMRRATSTRWTTTSPRPTSRDA